MAELITLTANWTTGKVSSGMISRQYDNNRYCIKFTGIPDDGGENLIYYLLIYMKTEEGAAPVILAPVQLASDEWIISNYFTQIVQQVKFQLCVQNEAGTFEAHSPIFDGSIRDSLDHDGEDIDIDTSELFDYYRAYVEERVSELIVAAGDVQIDTSLSVSGAAAEAAAVGAALSSTNERLEQIEQGGAGLSNEQKTTLINIVNAIGVFNVDTGQALLDAFNDAWLDYYTVRNVLTGCTSSNAATTVNKNSAYSATLTANEDFEIRTVSVTMGGVDITSTAYSNGVISISEVTGSLVITATAVDVNTWTDGVPYTLRWTDGYSIDLTTGEPVATSNRNVTQFLNCEDLHHITGTNITGVYCYDSEKNYLGTAMNAESDGVRPLYIGSGYIRIVHNAKNSVVTPIVLPSIDETMTPVTGTKYQFAELTFEKDIWDTGNVVDNSASSNYISNFVRCYQFSTINITTSGRRALWFYDANKNTITGSRNVANSGNITIPSEAVFARVAFKIGNTKGYPCVVLAS